MVRNKARNSFTEREKKETRWKVEETVTDALKKAYIAQTKTKYLIQLKYTRELQLLSTGY